MIAPLPISKPNQALLLALATALVASMGCSTTPPEPQAVDSGVTVPEAGPDRRVDVAEPTDSGPFAHQPVWDPVWHETKPANWPVAPKAHVEGCGQGCVVALDIPAYNLPFHHYQASSQGVVSMNMDKHLAFYSRFDNDKTWLLGSKLKDLDRSVAPCVHKNLLSLLWSERHGVAGEVRVTNLVTGETKVAFRYTDTVDRDEQEHLRITVLNDKYVFWYRYGTGLMSLNMQTGERRWLNRTECEDWYATPTGLFCDNAPMSFIDQETGKLTPLDPGGALQVDGNISLQRDEVVWVDYRDPPGRSSSFDGYRSGGEIYIHNLVSHETSRVTHDSPDHPTAKAYPAIGKELIVWKQARKGHDQNPKWAEDIYAAARDLIVLDGKTNKRCRIHSDLADYFTHMVVRGRWVYGNMGYVIGLDVDDPAIGCVPE